MVSNFVLEKLRTVSIRKFAANGNHVHLAIYQSKLWPLADAVIKCRELPNFQLAILWGAWAWLFDCNSWTNWPTNPHLYTYVEARNKGKNPIVQDTIRGEKKVWGLLQLVCNELEFLWLCMPVWVFVARPLLAVNGAQRLSGRWAGPHRRLSLQHPIWGPRHAV